MELHHLTITSKEANDNFYRVKGIYKEFENTILNIPFRLTKIGNVHECVIETSLSLQEEDRITSNILNEIEV